MKKGGTTERKSLGFTIVETMIVLAVSGGLFLVAALYISGKQAKTDFQVGVRDVQTKIQQIINEVNSGYYPQTSLSCPSSAGVPLDAEGNIRMGLGGSYGQGEHSSCIFVGKAIVVTEDKLYIFSLAGLRTISESGVAKDVQNLKDAHITAITPAQSANPTVQDTTEVYKLPNGLTFTGKYNEAGSNQRPFAFLFTTSLAGENGSMAGSQTVDLRGFRGGFSGVGESTKAMATQINKEQKYLTDENPFPKAPKLQLCLQSGGTTQSAWIIVGGDSSGNATRMQIKGNTTCS